MTRVQQLYTYGGYGYGTPVATPDTTNVEGYPAYHRTWQEELVQQLVTNTLGNTFYVNQKDVVAGLEKTIDAAITKDALFVAKAAVYARQHGFMRSAPILALVKLSKVQLPAHVWDFTFNNVILTPKDLVDFTTILASKGRGEGGRRIKRTVGLWLATRLNEYWTIKYGSEKGAGYNLNGLLRVYHPRMNNQLANYILGNGKYDNSLVQINMFEALKIAPTAQTKIECINAGRLPHEVATTFAGSDREVWKAIVPQMPIFALLRNLATIERQGVMSSVQDLVINKLTNENAVRNSKIFPFQFLNALEHVQNPRVKDALRDAIDLSFNNLPDISGTTAIALDVSGSMSGNPIKIASLFAVSLYKKTNGNSIFITFSDRAKVRPISLRDSTLTQANNIYTEGGTNTSTSINLLASNNTRVDNFILITDEAQNAGTPFSRAAAEYRKKFNPNMKLFVINVASYVGALVSPKDANTFYIYGWSDRVLDYIAFQTSGGGNLVNHINSVVVETMNNGGGGNPLLTSVNKEEE